MKRVELRKIKLQSLYIGLSNIPNFGFKALESIGI